MALLDQTKPASFRGVPFLWVSDNISGGRKTVTHEYPNSDERFVEDLGLLQKAFTVSGLVIEPGMLQKRDRLIAALEQPGLGDLVLALSGPFQVAVKSYSVSVSTADYGSASFNMSFEVSGQRPEPGRLERGIPVISGLVDDVTGIAEGFVAEGFKVVADKVGNFPAAVGKLESFVDTIDDARFLTFAEKAASEVLDVNIREYRRDLVDLVSDPIELAKRNTGLMTSLNDLAGDPLDRLNISRSLFNFGDDDVPIIGSTLGRQERLGNNLAINGQVALTAVSQAYKDISQIDFRNIEQLDQVVDIVETQYQKVSKLEIINSV